MDADRYLRQSIDLFQPHIILQSQYFEPPAKPAADHCLMMAVLDVRIRSHTPPTRFS
jgi:hypothetical protein